MWHIWTIDDWEKILIWPEKGIGQDSGYDLIKILTVKFAEHAKNLPSFCEENIFFSGLMH